MKTVVLGLFDRLEDAEGVLEQLSGAPLDLDAVQVLHRDTALQRRLSEGVGIEPRRSLRTGFVFGGLLGAALGFAAGWGGADAAPLLDGPGVLLSLAGGSLLGSLVGALGGVLSESSPIPDRHAEVTLEALRQGATMISVQTASLPTARAIGELFRAGGSRLLDEAPGVEGAAGLPSDARFQTPESGTDSPGSTGEAESDLPEDHAPFAPPWRREAGGDPSADDPESSAAIRSAQADAGAVTADSTSSPDPFRSANAAEPEAASPVRPIEADPNPDARTGIRHGQTVTAVDRSSREVHPRDLPAPSPSPDRPDPESPTGGSEISEASRDPAVMGASKPTDSDPKLETLALPNRVLTALRKAGLEDLAALRAALRRPGGLEAIPGIGPASRQEIERVLGAASQGAAEPSKASSATSSEAMSPRGSAAKPASRSESAAAASLEDAETRDPRLEPVSRAADELLRELFGHRDG